MTSTADVIVLSSSPNPLRSPSPGCHVANQVSLNSPRGATPPPVPLTSDLSQPHTRSRFFPNPTTSVQGTHNVTRPKKRSINKDPTPNSSDKIVPRKPRRKAKSTETQGITAPGELLPEPVGIQQDAVKPGKARPRKNAKKRDTGNMTLSGKVTKTSGDPLAMKSNTGGKKGAATKPSSSEKPSDESTSTESNVLAKDDELHLDQAMRRRMDWTPPRDTAPQEIATVKDGGSQDPNGMDGFGKLLSDYNYSGSALNPRDLVQNANSGGPTKRRRIELVDPEIQALLNGGQVCSSDRTSAQGGNTGSSAKSKKTTKGKPKKFNTLTARMTAQYANDDIDAEEPVVECGSDIRTAKSKRRKPKEAEKESSFTVLSPEAAVELVNDQDLIFGTCSQLEREDSPQTLREIQQAIRASESLIHLEKTHPEELMSVQEPSTRSISCTVGSKKLWCVGARDSEGSLIQSETPRVVDLTEEFATPAQRSHKNMRPANHKPYQKDWFELEYAGVDPPPETKSTLLTVAKERSGLDTVVLAPAPASAVAPALEAATTAQNTVSESANDLPPEAVGSQPSASQVPSMPHYTGFTDAELSKQISTFGFKAVRGRQKMIDLLKKCWESKHGTIAASDSQSKHETEQQKEPVSEKSNGPDPTLNLKAKSKSKPKKSSKNRNSPGKTKSTTPSHTNTQKNSQKGSQGEPITGISASFINIEEIQDSEEEIIPSPSHVQKHYTDIYSKFKTGSQVQQHSLDILTKSPSPSPTKHKVVSLKTSAKRSLSSASITRTAESKQISLSEISAQITQAVRVQPRLSSLSSRDSRVRPTWHEKILMYDPIVLEDFTAWLNTEGLGLVGEDRELGTATVREWCESKGICCCWKKNASW